MYLFMNQVVKYFVHFAYYLLSLILYTHPSNYTTHFCYSYVYLPHIRNCKRLKYILKAKVNLKIVLSRTLSHYNDQKCVQYIYSNAYIIYKYILSLVQLLHEQSTDHHQTMTERYRKINLIFKNTTSLVVVSKIIFRLFKTQKYQTPCTFLKFRSSVIRTYISNYTQNGK